MLKLKRDKYRQARGGNSRLLEIRCEKCNELVCLYQKDGPGILKRLYIDRINGHTAQEKLTCPKCKELLGVYFIYKKENRPAYRLFAGAVTKQIISAKKIKPCIKSKAFAQKHYTANDSVRN